MLKIESVDWEHQRVSDTAEGGQRVDWGAALLYLFNAEQLTAGSKH